VVATALQFAELSPAFVSNNFPVGVRRTHIDINGQNAVDIGDMNDPRQTINVGRSFWATIHSKTFHWRSRTHQEGIRAALQATIYIRNYRYQAFHD
jgi:hypothetical protein